MADKRVNRRSFLKLAAAGTAGSFVPGLSGILVPEAKAQVPGFENLVVISLDGGAAWYNMFQPVVGQFMVNNPVTAIDPNVNQNILPLTNLQFAHPSLVNVHDMLMAGDGILLNRVGYAGHSRSHNTAQTAFKSGVVGDMDADGLGNRYACFSGSNSPYKVVSVSGESTFIRGGCPQATAVNGLESLEIETYRNNAGRDVFARNAAATLAALGSGGSSPQRQFVATNRARAQEAADNLEQFQNSPLVDVNGSPVNFPNSGIGRRLEDIARFIGASGTGLIDSSVYFVGQGGYDTHGNQNSRLTDLLSDLDTALFAFSRALGGSGTWSRTVIVVISEFGRTLVENQGNPPGQDHGTYGCMLLLGGAVNGAVGGRVIGPPPTAAELLPQNLTGGRVYNPSPGERIDYRAVYLSLMNSFTGGGGSSLFAGQNIENSPFALDLVV